MEKAHKTWAASGIAKQVHVVDMTTLKQMLEAYHIRYPLILPNGVKSVNAADAADDFFMSTDGRGNFTLAEIEHKGFNSKRDLFSAFDKCARQAALTPHEEYALEVLWHEIWHNRQRGAKGLFLLDQEHPVRRLAEGVTQWTARLTYPRFVEHLGGQAQHQAWVLENGYGYADTVGRLRAIAQAAGVEELDNSFKSAMVDLNLYGDLLVAGRSLAATIAKIGKKPERRIQAALSRLFLGDEKFSTALLGLRSE